MKRNAFYDVVNTYVEREGLAPAQSGDIRLTYFRRAQLLFVGSTAARQVAVFGVVNNEGAWVYHVLHADTSDGDGIIINSSLARDVKHARRGVSMPGGIPGNDLYLPYAGRSKAAKLGGVPLHTEYSQARGDKLTDPFEGLSVYTESVLGPEPATTPLQVARDAWLQTRSTQIFPEECLEESAFSTLDVRVPAAVS